MKEKCADIPTDSLQSQEEEFSILEQQISEEKQILQSMNKKVRIAEQKLQRSSLGEKSCDSCMIC